MWPIANIKEWFKKRREVITEIDPALMKQNEAYAHIAKAYAFEKGKRQKAEETIKQLTQPTDKSEIAAYLQEQKKDLVERDIGIDASVRDFFKYARLKKKSLHVLSGDKERDFGILRDVGFARNGLISVYAFGMKRPIISGKTLNDIFANVNGLRNEATLGFVTINLNKEGEMLPNLNQVETPNVIIDFNKKINILNYDMKPFIERLTEKDIVINEQFDELRKKDILTSELTMELNEEKMKSDVLKNENSTYKTSLSDNLNQFKEIQKSYHNLSKNLTILEEDNEVMEKSLEEKDKIIDEIHVKLTAMKQLTTAEQIQEEMQHFIEWYESIITGRQVKEQEMAEQAPQKPAPRVVKA